MISQGPPVERDQKVPHWSLGEGPKSKVNIPPSRVILPIVFCHYIHSFALSTCSTIDAQRSTSTSTAPSITNCFLHALFTDQSFIPLTTNTFIPRNYKYNTRPRHHLVHTPSITQNRRPSYTHPRRHRIANKSSSEGNNRLFRVKPPK